MTDDGHVVTKEHRNNSSHGLAAYREMKELSNGSLSLDRIKNIYTELGRTNNCKFIKCNENTCRDEGISRKGGKRGMVKNQIQLGTTCKHRAYVQIINMQQHFPDHLWVIFSPNRVYHLSNHIDLEKERI